MTTMQTTIANIQTKYNEVEAKVVVLESENAVLKNKVTTLEDRVEIIDNQARQLNIIIGGVSGSPDEIQDETEKKVKDLFQNALKINENQVKNMKFEKNFRLKGAKTLTKPILVRFTCNADKRLALEANNSGGGTLNTNGEPIWLKQDLSPKWRFARKKLSVAFQEAKSKNCEVKVINDYLVINGVRWIYDHNSDQIRDVRNNRT